MNSTQILRLISFTDNPDMKGSDGYFVLELIEKAHKRNKTIMRELINEVTLNVRDAAIWIATIGMPQDEKDQVQWYQKSFEKKIEDVIKKLNQTGIKNFTEIM